MRYFLALLSYRLAFIVLIPVLLIVILLRSRSQPAYRHRLLERLGFLPKSLNPGGIIIHAASVGEVIALKTTIDLLLADPNGLPITVTSFTPTGSSQIKKLFAGKVQHCYLPIDNTISVKLFLAQLKPSAMVFMETELWPEIIAQCHHKRIKLMLINGRLSKKSLKSYQKISWLITPTLNHFDRVLTQSHENYHHFIGLGRKGSACSVSGNLKFDMHITDELKHQQAYFSQILPNDRPIWLVASTHVGDEDLTLSALKQIKVTVPDLLMFLVPRHPERFDEVAALCLNNNFQLVRRSSEQTITESTDIFLLDTLGELFATFTFATLVTMGGSFSRVGGHNPLEPALFKKPVMVGQYMSNFAEVLTQLQHNQGIVQLAAQPNSSDLVRNMADEVSNIVNSVERQKSLGDNAYDVVITNQGASQRTVDTLMKLLNEDGSQCANDP